MNTRSAATLVLAPGMVSAVMMTGLVMSEAHPALVLIVALVTVAYGWRLLRKADWF